MKKTVKPSSWPVILFGIMAVVCIIDTVTDFINKPASVFPDVLIDMVVAAAFVWVLYKFFSQKKILYDEKGFTVGEKTYAYSEITDAKVDSEHIIRSASTLRIIIYTGEEAICSFTKDDKGGKDFIAVLKNNDVPVNIEV